MILIQLLKCCIRKGSLDADIEESSIEINDFQWFFQAHPKLEQIFFQDH